MHTTDTEHLRRLAKANPVLAVRDALEMAADEIDGLREVLRETYVLANAYGPEKSPPDEIVTLARARKALGYDRP